MNKRLLRIIPGILLEPNDFIAYSNRGASYLEVGDYNSAITDFNRAIEIKEDHSHAYYGRGCLLLLQDNVESAKADFQKSVEFDNEGSSAFLEWGLLEVENGNYSKGFPLLSYALKTKNRLIKNRG
ncbi:MAG: tetratricopeptide repeat protein [Bacteroidetes bacterium]|nr:tetratricopeptide repeat protein [Bacteroidota bacterium]